MGAAIIKRIDQYVLRETLTPIIATILTGLLVLSAARLVMIFDLVIGNEDGLTIVARLLAAFVPHYLSFMLPFALYFGSYMAARQLSLYSEVAILQATGTSIARVFASLLVLGVVFTILNTLVVGWFEPLGRYAYRGLTHRLINADFYLKARDSTFMKIGDRTLFVEKINPDRHSFVNVMIFEPLENGGSLTITAPTGAVVKTPQQMKLWLFDGTRKIIGDPKDLNAVQSMTFAALDIPFGDGLEPFRPRGKDEMELLLPELLTPGSRAANATAQEIQVQLHKKLVIAFSALFLPMLAVSLAIQSSRRKNFYQTVFALLVVILYHQLVEAAADTGEKFNVNPAYPLWLIFATYSVLSVLLFYVVTARPGSIWDNFSQLLDGLLGGLRGRRGQAGVKIAQAPGA
ncbi:MAG: LptF/LptG family permease [Aestuariivirga sp.]|uniref:LptF/LptG family permease n=1 Tax=Aestuariivirga sp. TaxID=2650926 RepID=UPI0038D1F444